jgi:hypothetical protein
MRHVDTWRQTRDNNYKEDWIKYYSIWSGKFVDQLRQKQAERSKLIAPATQNAASPDFSHDGKTVAYTSAGGVQDGRLTTGGEYDIATVPYNDRKGGPVSKVKGASEPGIGIVADECQYERTCGWRNGLQPDEGRQRGEADADTCRALIIESTTKAPATLPMSNGPRAQCDQILPRGARLSFSMALSTAT